MPEPIKPAGLSPSPTTPGSTCPAGRQAPSTTGGADTVVCERCGGANVYRMHAVWRCADCGYKTDCCGW